MTSQPWQNLKDSEQLIAVLDVAHGVEQNELEQFLRSSINEHAVTAKVHECVLPMVRDRENPVTTNLRPLLELPGDTMVLPLRVVWRTSLQEKNTRPRPRDLLFGNPRHPGPFRARRILRQHPERVVCIVGEPATIDQLRDRLKELQGGDVANDELASFIAGQAGLALDVSERRLRGSRYKVPLRVADTLLASAKFRGALDQVSAETGRSMDDLLHESEEIMKELISKPQPFWLDVMAQLNHWVMRLGYDADVVINKEGLERVRQWSREYPTALLWTHKTHVDGFAVNAMCADNDFPAPHILGGVNMAFAGLGFIARRAGAIFIRRSFQDDLLYKAVLRQYIGYLMEKRFPLSWAFEGTRSRVGKLMPPRYGLLKYVMDSAHATGAENLHIIPISISYDMIGDVKDYAAMESGATKRPESLSWFIGYLRGLRQPMGKIYFDFGEPVVLPKAPSPDDPRELQRVAFAVGVAVNKVSPITLPSLISMVLLGSAPRALTADELRLEVVALTDWARKRHIGLTRDLDDQDAAQVSDLIGKMIASGLLTRYDDGPEQVFTIAAEQHVVASYYRNMVIHYFLNKSIIELALMNMTQLEQSGSDAFWEEAERLRDYFKFEFFYAPKDEFRRDVSEELSRYQPAWEAALDEPGAAQAIFSRLQPRMAHAVLLPFVEAYRVVADVLARQAPGDPLTEKDCVQKSLAYGRQAYLQRRISSEASIGRLLFSNAYRLMDNLELVEGEGDDLAERRLQLAQSFRGLQRRIERVRAAALP
ncbi:glycerol-3-phosphate 1-O-acyltransferase [Congregibacter brevis]|uniref:Glycerol-3-phosphate acyltransferase n=1 Tax=Congregibacter brevis TaxID=3081201 RepID=A0ABZ0IG23_9GAMM|nr:glycerol-3-phosphate 1-O-acyltransferase [Congregibacter sp. IMCC45268]